MPCIPEEKLRRKLIRNIKVQNDESKSFRKEKNT